MRSRGCGFESLNPGAYSEWKIASRNRKKLEKIKVAKWGKLPKKTLKKTWSGCACRVQNSDFEVRNFSSDVKGRVLRQQPLHLRHVAAAHGRVDRVPEEEDVTTEAVIHTGG